MGPRARAKAPSPPAAMVKSKRVTDMKNQRFAGNVLKRGEVPKSISGKKSLSAESPYKVGPVLLAFFLFVVVGSAVADHSRGDGEQRAAADADRAAAVYGRGDVDDSRGGGCKRRLTA